MKQINKARKTGSIDNKTTTKQASIKIYFKNTLNASTKRDNYLFIDPNIESFNNPSLKKKVELC